MNRLSGMTAIVIAILIPQTSIDAKEWTVPIGGNTFHTAPNPSRQGFRRTGSIKWSNPNSVYSVFFRADQRSELRLRATASGNDGRSLLRAKVGKESFEFTVEGPKKRIYDIGRISVPAGYVRVDLQGVERTGESFAEVFDLILESDLSDLKLDFVKSNKGNMFYWGRRGPSVHLRYDVPKEHPIRFAYSEITVPVGQDPIGSYFMANGFGEGYFGIQVNGPSERRVLFSVWSPFKTDNPRDIPKDQQIVALSRGQDVHIGEFGNEGSGGQSYLIYPWKAGRTYRFLTEVTPDGKGNTIYASWFCDKSANEWRLIARFRRPKTDTHYRGFHSFLESFSPAYGHIGRQAHYENVWVHDVTGVWHECTRASLSVDATGRGRHRLDFDGGSIGDKFFMRNCGFFNETGQPGKLFTRNSTASQKPKIDIGSLPN